jgi:predicted MFS family arabinose efflux permease
VASVLAPVAGSTVALAVALFVLGLGWNFCFVAGSALLTTQLHYDERGRIQGTNDVLVSLASGAGSLATGLVFAAGGMVSVGAVGLAITLIFAVFGVWRRTRPVVTSPSA